MVRFVEQTNPHASLQHIIRIDDLPPDIKEKLSGNAKNQFAEAIAQELSDLQPLSLEDWSNKFRVLPTDAAESGRFRMARTPYLKGIADALDSTEKSAQIVAVKKGSQLGFSELAVNWIGKSIHQQPVSIMFMQETMEKVRRTMKQRVIPMLKSPVFTGILAGGKATQSEISYPGGMLTTWGSNSPSSYSSTTAGRIILDEFARYPSNVRKEGDPLTLAEARLATFGVRGKLYIPSTPVEDEQVEGSFELVYQMGDCQEYFVPCPHCGHMDYLRKDRFVVRENPVQGLIVCMECGEMTEETPHKPQMLSRGEWRSTKQRESYNVTSFHCPGLLAPLGWMSWDGIAQRLINARAGKINMRPVINTCFGDSYSEEVETSTPESVREKHTTQRPRGIVPKGVGYLTMGVDVQRGWLVWEVKGWKQKEHSVSVDHGKIKHDLTSEKGRTALKEVIRKVWETESGVFMPVQVCAIDSGDGQSTSEVYRFASENPQPIPTPRGWAIVSPRTVIAMKGSSRPSSEQVIERATPVKKRVSMAQPIRLWVVGSSLAKLQLYRALAYESKSDQYGAVDYPAGYHDYWFAELVSEPVIIKRHADTGKAVVIFGKPRGRNEALDLHVLNRGAAEVFGCAHFTKADWARMLSKPKVEKEPQKKQAAREIRNPRRKKIRDSI